jgi:hypothetical protein
MLNVIPCIEKITREGPKVLPDDQEHACMDGQMEIFTSID